MASTSDGFDPRALAAERLGWFGGSFDPPHRGHLHVARTAVAAVGLEHVAWVPAARSPHKDERPVPGAERARLVELLLADDADAGGGLAALSSVWTGELARGGSSFTIDSLREVHAARRAAGREGGLFLLLGSDQLVALDRWRAIDEVLELARPLVVPRPGAGRELFDELRERLSSAALERVEAGLLSAGEVDLSSTDLRAARGAGREDLDLTPRVAARVAERGLYRDGPGGAPRP